MLLTVSTCAAASPSAAIQDLAAPWPASSVRDPLTHVSHVKPRFNSAFPFIHDHITEAAFDGVPISRSMLRLVQQANRRQDVESVRLVPTIASLGKRLVASAAYRYDEHFDRPPHLTHAEAYEASFRMVMRNADAAVELIGAGEHEEAARILGKVLHAWQDLAAHSDIAFLADEQRAGLGPGSTPFPLRITSYDRRAGDPERPSDPLDYAHADFALDHPRKNAFARGTEPGTDAPRFDVAVRAATMLSRECIASIARTVSQRYSEAAWKAFLAHNASRTNGLWFSALLVEGDGRHGGVRIARSVTHLFPPFQPAFTAFTDGDVQLGFQISLGRLGPRITPFVGLAFDVPGAGLSYGAGASLRAIHHEWLPDLLLAGDSDRGLLAGLSARF